MPPLQPSLQTSAAARSCEPSCVLQLSPSNAPGIWGSGSFRSNSTPKRRLMLSTTTWTRAGDITRLSTELESSAIVIGMFTSPILSEKETASRTFLLIWAIPWPLVVTILPNVTRKSGSLFFLTVLGLLYPNQLI
ncbi:hypothetical protein LINPERHAP1_LOCUS18047 [Linum perenne]